MPLSSLNPFGRKIPEVVEQPKEVEMAAPSALPVAPPVVEATVTPVKQEFEWNTGKLFRAEPGHSTFRTWAVRILSTLLVFPLLLTVITDIGRRVAFSAGLVNGKSFSLIDKTSDACQAVAGKVKSVYASYNKPKTLEELNKDSEVAIKAHANKLIDGFRGLNGGYFHSNSSFSTPAAISAEKQIESAKKELVRLVNGYAVRNATGTADFGRHLDTAYEMATGLIEEAAGDDIYIQNKVFRPGPRPLLSEVVNKEFENAFEKVKNELAVHFIDLARHEPDFGVALSRGVRDLILTQKEAVVALESRTDAVFTKGLETGVDAAVDAAQAVLKSAVKAKVVTEEEATMIDDSIIPEVEVLAAAAAKDVARTQTTTATDAEVAHELVKTAEKLRQLKKLKPEDETQFLAAAKAQLAKAREAIDAEVLRQKQEADEIEAKRVAETQKAQDQASLLNKFVGVLELITKKQELLSGKFTQYADLELERKSITDALEHIQNDKVTIGGVKMTVLQAAHEYNKATIAISKSKTSAADKAKKMAELASLGFTQLTIDKINESLNLSNRFAEVVKNQSVLAQEIDQTHGDVLILCAKYKVYKKNHFRQLESHNQDTVVQLEKKVNDTQKALDKKHKLLSQAGKISDQLRPDPMKVINVDKEANEAEIDAMVAELEESKAPVATEEPAVPAKPTHIQRIGNGLYTLTYPVRAPYYAASALYHRVWGPSEPAAAPQA